MNRRDVESPTIPERDGAGFSTDYAVSWGFRPDPGDPGLARFAFVAGCALVLAIAAFCVLYGLVVSR